MKLSEEELRDAIDDGAEEVDFRPWRHGSRITYLIERGDKSYLATVACHHDDGLQIYGDTELVPAKLVTVQKWVPDLTPAQPEVGKQ